ncbi:MAG: hypothetical protein WA144_02475 [Candidatus Methanoperedens sp.]
MFWEFLEIFKIHTARIPPGDVDFETLSDDTEGFTGADIASLLYST